MRIPSHHTRSIGGPDDDSNLVNLTPEEHYVAHQLLVKIYPNEPKLIFAANMMTVDKTGYRVNNKKYGWLRKKLSETLSKNHKGKNFSIKTQFKKGMKPNKSAWKKGSIPYSQGRMYITNGIQNKIVDIDSNIPEGWRKGQFKSYYTNNGKTGKHIRTEETKKKISNNRKGKATGSSNGMANDSNRQKVAQSKIGKKFYNDGINSILTYPGTEPSGFKLGKI